jgi:uncharacterized protein YwgA
MRKKKTKEILERLKNRIVNLFYLSGFDKKTGYEIYDILIHEWRTGFRNPIRLAEEIASGYEKIPSPDEETKFEILKEITYRVIERETALQSGKTVEEEPELKPAAVRTKDDIAKIHNCQAKIELARRKIKELGESGNE